MQRIPLQRAKDAGLTNALILLNRQHADTESEVAKKADSSTVEALAEAVDGKQDVITDLDTIRSGAALGATSVQTETDPVFAASPAAGIEAADITAWNGKQDTINDLDTIRSGAALGATAVQPDGLATVATTGSYTDLTNKPTIPTVTNTYSATSTNAMSGKAVASAISTAVSSVLKYKGTKTSYSDLPTSGNATGDVWNITNADSTHGVNAGDNVAWTGSAWDVLAGTVDISGKADKADLATVATTGSYTDLSDKPTIPTVNNATLTIQKNGSTVKTFTANASTAVTANITVPTKLSELTDDLGTSPTHTHSQYLPITGGTLTGSLTLQNSNADITSTSTSSPFIDIQFTDANNSRLGFIRAQDNASNTRSISINAVNKAYKPAGGITVSIDDNDVVTTTALTPSTTDSSTKIATTAFVKAQGYITEHQDISGKADKSDIPTKVSELSNDSGYITASDSITGNASTATKAENDGNGNVIASTYLPLKGGILTGSVQSTIFLKQAANINIDSAQTSQKEDWALRVIKSDAQTTNTGTLMQVGAYQFSSQDYFAGIRVGNPRQGNLPTADTIAAGTDNTGAQTTNMWNSIGMRYNYKSNKAYAWINATPTLDITSPEFNGGHLVSVGMLINSVPKNTYIAEYRNVDNSYLEIRGATSYKTGAYLDLCGKDSTTSGHDGGKFVIAATDGTNFRSLIGTPSGSLTWCGKNVLTELNLDFGTWTAE